MALHSDGGPYVHNTKGHLELPAAFRDAGSDQENHVMILTGSGDRFCTEIDAQSFPSGAHAWYDTFWQGKHLLSALLDIEVPVIGVANGPAYIHSELLLLSDMVIAAQTASFRDEHLRLGAVPGDGMHIVLPLLLGEIRGRYFLLTGQEIDASQALNYGLANEITTPGEALPGGWELARDLTRIPILTLRYARNALTHRMKRILHESLGYGLALGGLPHRPG